MPLTGASGGATSSYSLSADLPILIKEGGGHAAVRPLNLQTTT